MIIGQKQVLTTINNLERESFPRFIILVGQKGGRKLIAKEIAKKLCASMILVSPAVDEVRNIIELSYKQSEPTLYIITDAEKMSVAAKNALLKVTEEPPRKAYFILISTDRQQIPYTLISRGRIIGMDSYVKEDVKQYLNWKHPGELSEDAKKLVIDYCNSFSDIEKIIKYDVNDFFDYLFRVLENINLVSSANSLKITNKLSLKEDDGKWDAKLFLNIFKLMCINSLQHYKNTFFYDYIKITSRYISELEITGLNKQSLLDSWVLDIRAVDNQ